MDYEKFFSDKTIGVLGMGHLGASVAGAIVRGGVGADHLLVAHRGSEASRARTDRYGLTDRAVSPEELARRADVVLILTRPQDIAAAGALRFKDGAELVSAAAGLTRETLAMIFGRSVVRAMVSSPETFDDGTAAGVIFPETDAARAVAEAAGMTIVPVSREDEIDAFTASICMPPLTAALDLPAEAASEALSDAIQKYPVLSHMTDWVLATAKRMKARADITLERVATKGGTTEAMAMAMRAGATPQQALERGIERSRELSEMASKGI